MPELKRLLIAQSLAPDQVALARVAFDIAWGEIAHLYTGPEAVSLGRTRLATMVLAVISEGRTDPVDLQQASLSLMKEAEAPIALEERRKKK